MVFLRRSLFSASERLSSHNRFWSVARDLKEDDQERNGG